MEVPLSAQPPAPSAEEVGARPGAGAVPRFERVAAGLLLAVYAGLWAVNIPYGISPWDVCQALFRIVSGLVTQVRNGALSFDYGLVYRGSFGLLNGLFLLTLVLAGQALLRTCGRDGFLGGRKFWMWSAAHAGASLGGYLWFLGLSTGRNPFVSMSGTQGFAVGSYSAGIIIGVAMLCAIRRRG